MNLTTHSYLFYLRLNGVRHTVCYFQLAAIYVLYETSHRQDSTYYGLCYTSHELNGRKEGNVLFNDALNTFYLRLYGVGHKVKDH